MNNLSPPRIIITIRYSLCAFLTLKKRGKNVEKARKKRGKSVFSEIWAPKTLPPCAYGNCVIWPMGSDTKNNQGPQGNISYRVLRPQWHASITNIRLGSINLVRLKTPIAQHRLVLYGARILKIQLEPIAALPPDHAALLRHYFTTIGYAISSPVSLISYWAARVLNFFSVLRILQNSKSKSALEGFCARPQTEAREDKSRGK